MYLPDCAVEIRFIRVLTCACSELMSVLEGSRRLGMHTNHMYNRKFIKDSLRRCVVAPIQHAQTGTSANIIRWVLARTDDESESENEEKRINKRNKTMYGTYICNCKSRA